MFLQRGNQKSCSNVFSMFEQSQIQEFKEAFGCIDQDRDGVIKKQDLKETYAQLGKLNIKDEELEEMLNEGKGPINFTVFLTLFGEKLNGTDPEDTILAAFKPFDPNGTGFVNKDDKTLLCTCYYYYFYSSIPLPAPPPAMALRATLGGAPHFGNHCTKASETWSWALIWMSHFSKLSYVVVSGRYNTQNLPTCLLPEIQQLGQLHKDKQAKGPMRNIP
uniref:Myosin light chain 7 n=1 Tax=Xiphophorus couchianus TaxID=32473 RepID=A0A3B5LX18_9TELE